MYLHLFLSLALFIISVIDFFPSQTDRPSKIFSRCLPLSLFPEILPVITVCSICFFPYNVSEKMRLPLPYIFNMKKKKKEERKKKEEAPRVS
jgi:hypothetical protein